MAELANRLRAKDPEGFKDWTDDEIEQAMLEKHPTVTRYRELAGEKPRIAAQNALAGKAEGVADRAIADTSAGKPPAQTPSHMPGYANLTGALASFVGGAAQGIPEFIADSSQTIGNVVRMGERSALRSGRPDLENKVIASGQAAAPQPSAAANVQGSPLWEAETEQGIAESPGMGIPFLAEISKALKTPAGTAFGVGSDAVNQKARSLGVAAPIIAGGVAAPARTALILGGSALAGKGGELASPAIAQATGEPLERVQRDVPAFASLAGMLAGGEVPLSAAAETSIPGAVKAAREFKGLVDSLHQSSNEMAGIGPEGPAKPAVEPPMGNILPKGGLKVEDPQNKPTGTQGALDTAISAMADKRSEIGGELAGSAIAGSLIHMVPIAGSIPGVPWIARRVGAGIGKRAGRVQDVARRAKTAAENAGENQPAGSVGAPDRPMGTHLENAQARATARAGMNTSYPLATEVPELSHMIKTESKIRPEGAPPSKQWTGEPEAAPAAPAPEAEAPSTSDLLSRYIAREAPAEAAPTAPSPSGSYTSGTALPPVSETAPRLTVPAPESAPVETAPAPAPAPPTEAPLARFIDRGAMENQFAQQQAAAQPTTLEALAAEGQMATQPPRPPAARPGGPATATESMNLLDRMQQMAKKPVEAPRPAAIKSEIPAEMERQQGLVQKADAKADKRRAKKVAELRAEGMTEAEADGMADIRLAEDRAKTEAHPAYKETYDKVIASGKPDKVARAAGLNAAEAAMKAPKEAPAAPTAPVEPTKAVEAAPEPTKAPEKSPEATKKTVQQLLDEGDVAGARDKARSENPSDEVVSIGPNSGLKVGDQLPTGQIITEITNGRIDMVSKPPKGGAKPGPRGKEYSAKEETDLERAIREADEATPDESTVAAPELVNNASAESGSGGSAEALSRTAAMAAKGEAHVVLDRGGNPRFSTEDGARSLRPGESFGVLHEDGIFDMMNDSGGKAVPSKGQALSEVLREIKRRKGSAAQATPKVLSAEELKRGQPISKGDREYSTRPTGESEQAALENRFKTIGKEVDRNGEAVLQIPGSKHEGPATECTTVACAVQHVMPKGTTKVMGFGFDENPGTLIEKSGGGDGHDFAVFLAKDGKQYIIDPWLRDTAGISKQVVFDLSNKTDSALIEKLYGDRKKWTEVVRQNENPYGTQKVTQEYSAEQFSPSDARKAIATQQSEIGFYSRLAKTVADLKQSSQPPETWLSYLKKQKRGIKAEELDWSNIESWLKERRRDSGKRPITKDEIYDFLRNNAVKVIEHRYGGEAPGATFSHTTKWRQYTVGGGGKGGTNHREFVLSIPPEAIKKRAPSVDPFRESTHYSSEREQVVHFRVQDRFIPDENGRFVMQVGYGPILAEGEATSRMVGGIEQAKPRGQKVMLIDEIQSDKAKAVARHGVFDQKAFDKANAEVESARLKYEDAKAVLNGIGDEHDALSIRLLAEDPKYYKRTAHGPEMATHGPEMEALNKRYDVAADAANRLGAKFREALTKLEQPGTTPGPFVGETSGYTDLAVKRILKIAADEGYDKVAFTTGNQQLDRYHSLVELFSKITAERKGNGQVELTGWKSGRYGNSKQGSQIIPERDMDLYVGKDPAARLIEQMNKLDKAKAELATGKVRKPRAKKPAMPLPEAAETVEIQDYKNDTRRQVKAYETGINGLYVTEYNPGEGYMLTHKASGLALRGNPSTATETIAFLNGLKEIPGVLETDWVNKDVVKTLSPELRSSLTRYIREHSSKEPRSPRAASRKSGIAFVSGKGLHIGEHGMRTFYDQELPGAFKRVLKGNVAIENLSLPGTKEVVHSLDLTPEMRAKISSEGFSQYKAEAGKLGDQKSPASLEDIRKELPKYFADRTYREGDDFVINTPGGDIRLKQTGHIEIDMSDFAEGRPGMIEAAQAGGITALAVKEGKLTISPEVVIRFVEKGELGHEVVHVAHDLATDKEWNAIESELAAQSEKTGTSVRELLAEGWKDYLKNKDQEPTTMLGKIFQRVSEFFEGIYRSYSPDVKSFYKSIESGKVFERAGKKGLAAKSRSMPASEYSVGGPKPVRASAGGMLSEAALINPRTTRSAVKGVLQNKVDLTPRLAKKGPIGHLINEEPLTGKLKSMIKGKK